MHRMTTAIGKSIFNTGWLYMLFFYAATSFTAQATELRIAVASNFAATANIIKQRFENEFSERIILIKGSTGKLYSQIRHGAPYDVFLAADVKRPELLEQQELVIDNSRKTYAIGQLALWSGKSSENILQKLKTGNFSKLAIANPKTAPYGQAAIEILHNLEIYNQVNTKLVYGENISQVFQFTQSGSADLGFVALSHVKHLSSNYWLPADKSHQTLQQQLVILKRTGQPELAEKFVHFILTNDIQQLIRQQGYETP